MKRIMYIFYPYIVSVFAVIVGTWFIQRYIDTKEKIFFILFFWGAFIAQIFVFFVLDLVFRKKVKRYLLLFISFIPFIGLMLIMFGGSMSTGGLSGSG